MLPYVDLRSGRQPATGVSGWPETHKYTFVSTFVLYLRVGHNRTCEPEDSRMATDQTHPLARYAHNADGSIAGWFCFPPPPLFGRCALCVTFACVSLNACFEPVLMRLKLRCLRCFSSGGVTQAQLRAVDICDLAYRLQRGAHDVHIHSLLVYTPVYSSGPASLNRA